jgi:hypothetical protein
MLQFGSLVGRDAGKRILWGACCITIGLGLVIFPLFLPLFDPQIWRPFYWCGSVTLLLGGCIVDATVFAILWRFFRDRWSPYFFRRVSAARPQIQR